MRIAFFQRDLPSEKHGGVADQVHLLANTLCEMGETVTVFSLSPAPADARYEVRSAAMPAWVRQKKILNRYLLGLYFAKADTRGFDVIHAHGDNYLLFGKRPQVRTYYGSAFKEALHAGRPARFFGQLGSYVLEWAGLFPADRRTAISPGTRAYLPAIDDVVPCGVDLRWFSPGGTRSRAPSLLFVGALKGRKRGNRMLEIFARVRDRIPEARLHMVLSERVGAPGVECHVGPDQRALLELYRSAWALCLPASYEGFGVPLVEAMACGTPVAAVPSDGTRYVLEDGRYGFLTPIDKMADVLIDLLLSPEKRGMWSKRGLERASSFSIRTAAETYMKIYHELLQCNIR